MYAEAEVAVAGKDRDCTQPKHEDPQCLLRRAPAASADRGRGVPDPEEGGASFGELKASVDLQMARMEARLDAARAALAALMRKVSGVASSTLIAGLQEAGDGVEGLPAAFYGTAPLLMDLQEIVVDAGAVRDSVASSFDAMDLQQWLMEAEKEIYGAVVQGFLREINAEPKRSFSPVEGCQQPALQQQQHPTDGTRNSSEKFESPNEETRQQPSTRRNPAEQSDSSRHCNHSEKRGLSHQEAERLMEEKVGSEIRCELQDVLYSSTFRDLVISQKKSDSSRHCNQSEESGVCREDAERMIEEKVDSEIRRELQDVLYSSTFRDLARGIAVQADLHKPTEVTDDEVDIRSKLQNEIHSTILEDLVKKLAVESVDHLIRTFIEDEVHKVFFAQSLDAWNSRNDMVQNEGHIKEEIDRVIFGGLTKDLIRDRNSSVLRSEDEKRPRDDLGRFTMIDSIEQLQLTPEAEGPDSDQHRVLLKQEISSCVRKNLKESDLQAEISKDKNVEEASEDTRKMQTREMATCLSVPPQGTNQEVFVPVTNFQEVFMNFEADICGKIGTATMRLKDLAKELANVSEQVNSLRRSELVYRRAFTGRCCDLQRAEAEVDLLGDEVERLVGLLRKTYRALDPYSPVLRHYIGIKEMMCLLGKELAMWHHVQ